MCGLLANGGSSRVVRSASRMTSAEGRSAEHSRRTMPDQGTPGVPGSWRYQELRRHEVPIVNAGVRCPGIRAATVAACSLGR